ncbi:MAG TPA: hypothetical protein VMU08_16685 [Rhizomicrobium sp.]|nr:hypothetical protein [Rhizomicrobium sp.]
MTVDREEASALLNDVAGIEQQVRQLLVYARVSDYLFLWGTIWVVGFTSNYFFRTQATLLWYGLEALGLAGTLAIAALHHRRAGNRNRLVSLRAALSVVAVIGFGTLWLSLAHMGWREQVTFWPTLLSFLLFQLGLWLGRGVALAALAIFAVSLLGYFVAGPYLHLWMAAAVGGAAIAGGFWLRR